MQPVILANNKTINNEREETAPSLPPSAEAK